MVPAGNPSRDQSPANTSPVPEDYESITRCSEPERTPEMTAKLRKRAGNHPVTSRPAGSTKDANAANDAYLISTADQLRQGVSGDAAKVMTMIRTLREQRDYFLYLSNDLEDDVAQARSKQADLTQQVRKLKAELRNTQAVGAMTSPDRPLSSIETSPAPAHRIRVKFPDAPMFNGNREKYEGWKGALDRKYRHEAERFNTESLKVDYAISRLEYNEDNEGPAQDVNSQLRADPTYFMTFDTLIQFLDELYKDFNEYENARTKFRKLRMKDSDEFTPFFTTFFRLSRDTNNDRDDRMLISNLKDKLPERLLKAYVSSGAVYDKISEFKKYLQNLDNHQRSEYQRKADKERRQANVIQSSGSVPAARPSRITSNTASATKSTNTLRTSQPPPETQSTACWDCGREGHRRGDPSCSMYRLPLQRSREPTAQVNQLSTNLDDASEGERDSSSESNGELMEHPSSENE